MWAHFVDPHDSYAVHPEFPAAGPGDRALYDGEVAATDAAIGRVLSSLERSALSSHTAVIVTADHGEAFGEHENKRHGFTLFEEEVRVPLIVRVPGVPPRTLDIPRSTIDLAPTIGELLHQPPSTRRRGVSLVRDWRPAEPAARAVIVDAPERVAGTARQAVVQQGFKVMLDKSGPKVFDLRADPAEKAPISGAESERFIAEARGKLLFLDPVPPAPCPSSGRSPKGQSDL
jgi:arylsulfatase A-like enzyme